MRLQTPANASIRLQTDNTAVLDMVVPDKVKDSELEYALSPEHQDLVINIRELPPLPLSPSPSSTHLPPGFCPTMLSSDLATTSALNKALEITKLSGQDDWIEWNWKLKGHFGMVDFWTTFIGDVPKLTTETPKHALGQNYPRKFSSLLLLISGPSTLSLIKLKSNNTATAQYFFLKSIYNTTTITIFNTEYRRINRCSIRNHKSLKKYSKEVTNARNKLKELKRPVDKLHVTCAFLDGLDSFYLAWKDMFLRGYARNSTSTVQGVTTMLVLTIEEILKLLIDRETSTPSLSQKLATQAFEANNQFKEKSKDSNTSKL